MNWRSEAACSGYPTDLFYPDERPKNMGRNGTDWDSCREICKRCPVRFECLEAALVEEQGLGRDIRAGMRGGLTPVERHRMRARRYRVA